MVYFKIHSVYMIHCRVTYSLVINLICRTEQFPCTLAEDTSSTAIVTNNLVQVTRAVEILNPKRSNQCNSTFFVLSYFQEILIKLSLFLRCFKLPLHQFLFSWREQEQERFPLLVIYIVLLSINLQFAKRYFYAVEFQRDDSSKTFTSNATWQLQGDMEE